MVSLRRENNWDSVQEKKFSINKQDDDEEEMPFSGCVRQLYVYKETHSFVDLFYLCIIILFIY